MAIVRKAGVLGVNTSTFTTGSSAISNNVYSPRQLVYTCPADCLRAEISLEVTNYSLGVFYRYELQKSGQPASSRMFIPILSVLDNKYRSLLWNTSYATPSGYDRGCKPTMLLPVFPGDQVYISVESLTSNTTAVFNTRVNGFEYNRTDASDDNFVPFWKTIRSETDYTINWDWMSDMGDFDYMELRYPIVSPTYPRRCYVVKRKVATDQYTALGTYYGLKGEPTLFNLEKANYNDTVQFPMMNSKIPMSAAANIIIGMKGRYT
ncbi:hypothetical protein [Delftia phage PhiW-14]|uniref:Uncharacterized protein n=1 Tax=Delftia phage PhiW-14 TaxID=665032 RepID=C9DG27_BPW14|nr:hypothetical protein DP-phiW-14_gp056 [Delftia phage PhiW-14]ACV50078.1 hypothetical protein [Delftia phage PhiW-14]